MAFIVRLTSNAVKDLKNAKNWYNEKQQDLGNVFLSFFNERIELLKEQPVMYRKIYKEVIKLAMKKFPFSIYAIYNTTAGAIDIIAILHDKQNVLKELQARIS